MECGLNTNRIISIQLVTTAKSRIKSVEDLNTKNYCFRGRGATDLS